MQGSKNQWPNKDNIMITWGINALNHDASIAVMVGNEVKYWHRSQEFSNQPGDPLLNSTLIKQAIGASGEQGPNQIVWYERPWLKKLRQLRAGQWSWAFNLEELPSRYLRKLNLDYAPIRYVPHHLSHAAAGFLTSPFDQATVVVLDAIGEFESASIWHAQGTSLTKLWSRSYPTSLGLFYSAFTDLIGLKPLGQEHVLQAMSVKGDPHRYMGQILCYWTSHWQLSQNLHRGVLDWPHAIVTEQDRCDIAAAVQAVFELQAQRVFTQARHLGSSNNLVYMGGCAMNSQFNQTLPLQWSRIWSLPQPGDSASSLGAALYHTQSRHSWSGPLAQHCPIIV